MPQVIDMLLSLRVSDVMAKTVVSVSENQTMSEVAEVMQQNGISSAPVVDDRGHLVGVISASDFVKREADYSSRGTEPRLVEAEGDQPRRLVSTEEDFAGCHMTSAVQSIDKGASLLRAARVMCAEHIHHLFVVDGHNQPAGIISTMDIVAALVNVVDEIDASTSRHRQTAKE